MNLIAKTLSALVLAFVPACGGPAVVEETRTATPTSFELKTVVDITYVLTAPGVQIVATSNRPIEVPPGTYNAHHILHPDFRYVADIPVNQDMATTVSLMSAVRLETFPEAEFSRFSIWNSDGTHMLSALNDPNVPVPVAPGRYQLRDAMHDFVYANVDVGIDEVAVARMGALEVVSPAAYHSEYAIHSEADVFPALRTFAHANRLVTVPPGSFAIRDYGHSNTFVWFPTVAVSAGEITRVTLGELEFHADSFDLYSPDCQTLRAAFHPAGSRVALPSGDYCIRRYGTGEVLAVVNVPAP